MTTIYNYHPQTREFIGEAEARLDPREQKPLVPAGATLVKPNKTARENETLIFDIDNNNWIIVPDYRGYIGYDKDGEQQKITEINVKPSTSWTIKRPFIFAEAKASKQNEIRAAFNLSITKPVNALNTDWEGGYDSALKLDAAKRLAELAGQSTVLFFGADNTAYKLLITDASKVILTVATDYQTKFAKKQALMQAVDALADTATQADFDAITINFND